MLRLRDGETQILAGLISDEDRKTADKVPGVGDLPYLGRLFSSTRDNKVKTEIVLLITPRLVRTLVRPEARATEFAAGTEVSTGTPGGALPPIPFPQPQAPASTPAAPQVQPRIPSGNEQVPFGGVRQPE